MPAIEIGRPGYLGYRRWQVEIAVDYHIKDGRMRFNQLSREAGISPRILSKELSELEMNGLVSRNVMDTRPVTVEYALTPYCKTLDKVLTAMESWGMNHRKRIINQ